MPMDNPRKNNMSLCEWPIQNSPTCEKTWDPWKDLYLDYLPAESQFIQQKKAYVKFKMIAITMIMKIVRMLVIMII